MAFDIDNNATVLFGGNTGATVVQDTWEWDGAGWTLVSSAGPPAREDHAMAYGPGESGSDVVMLYGGYRYFRKPSRRHLGVGRRFLGAKDSRRHRFTNPARHGVR